MIISPFHYYLFWYKHNIYRFTNPFHLIYSIILSNLRFVNAKIRQTVCFCDIFVGINYNESTKAVYFICSAQKSQLTKTKRTKVLNIFVNSTQRVQIFFNYTPLFLCNIAKSSSVSCNFSINSGLFFQVVMSACSCLHFCMFAW